MFQFHSLFAVVLSIVLKGIAAQTQSPLAKFPSEIKPTWSPETTATTTGTTTVATPTEDTTTVSNGGATQTIASVALLILTAGAILH
ncbi:hypothetical protein L0F63_006496 [Massospora cicadina]|nr:hypothetical protein L0F63_006496 [Massospora cicadina]